MDLDKDAGQILIFGEGTLEVKGEDHLDWGKIPIDVTRTDTQKNFDVEIATCP